MRPGFSDTVRDREQALRMIRDKDQDPKWIVSLIWSQRFNLPPNDPRLLSLTVREALEQIADHDAWSEFRAMKQRSSDSDGSLGEIAEGEDADPDFDEFQREFGGGGENPDQGH